MAAFNYRRALSPITLTASSLVLLVLFAYAPRTFADPDPAVIQDPPHSSSADAAAAAASSSSSSSSGPSTAPGAAATAPVDPIPPIVPGPGISKGLGFEFSKHLGFNAGAGLGGLLGGILPGVGGFAVPPIGGDVPPVDGGGYLGMPWFLGPQYIPQTWWGSALAAKGDLLFPIAIFIFAVVGVILTIKFLLALLVPFLAKKWAIAEALTGIKGGRLRRSVDETGDVPQDSSKAHQAHIDELTGKVVHATQQLPQGIHQGHGAGQRFQGRFAEPDHGGQDSDNDDSDGDFDG